MKQFGLVLFSSLLSTARAIDLVFDSVKCDMNLPAYTEEDGISMVCNGSRRCSFGDQAVISGELIYKGLDSYNLNNTMGYVSAKLQLMTMEYDLFKLLPFNFCGEWIRNAAYNEQECPADGVYHFEVPYLLPEGGGISTWFATGWQGVSYLKIYKSQQEASALLAHCKIHFKTYVTDSGESNWYALPSAAQTTIILFGVLGILFIVVLCLACRPSRKHPTDEDYVTNFKELTDDNDKVLTERDEEDSTPPEPEEKVETKARWLMMRMNYKQK